MQKRIKDIVDQGHKVSISYKQKVKSHDLQATSEKPILFNRSIDSFSREQREFVTSNLKDYFQQFNFYSKAEEDNQDLHETTPELLQEQQTKFNYARFEEIDDQKAGLIDKLNTNAMEWIKELRKNGEHKIFATNIDTPVDETT